MLLARYRSIPAQPVVADLRQAPGNGEAVDEVETEETETVDEPSYRDLQERAKELGIAANQSREDLEAAIEEAES